MLRIMRWRRSLAGGGIAVAGEELHVVKPAVETLSSQELPVSPLLHDPAGFENDDSIGAAHGRETMGDDERRLVLHEVDEGARD
jgi:hypothetical protein